MDRKGLIYGTSENVLNILEENWLVPLWIFETNVFSNFAAVTDWKTVDFPSEIMLNIFNHLMT